MKSKTVKIVLLIDLSTWHLKPLKENGKGSYLFESSPNNSQNGTPRESITKYSFLCFSLKIINNPVK